MSGNGEKPDTSGAAEPKKKRKNRPGQGRKKLDKTLYKEASEIYRKAHPQIASEAVRRALGDPIRCPKCGHELPYDGNGDKDLLKHIDDRVLGKAKQVSEIDLNAKVELSNPDLVKLFHELLYMQDQYQAQPTDALEAQVKLLPLKPTENTAIQSVIDPVFEANDTAKETEPCST